MAMSKFGSKKAATKKTPPKRKARYGGITEGTPRYPAPSPGVYKLRVTKFEEGEVRDHDGVQNVKLELEVLELDEKASAKHEVGDKLFAPFMVQGKGAQAGRGRMKSFIIAAAGFEDCASYDEWDPDGYGIDAFLGEPSEEPYGEDCTLIGAEVILEVTKGSAKKDPETGEPTGEFWGNNAWSAIEEDE